VKDTPLVIVMMQFRAKDMMDAVLPLDFHAQDDASSLPMLSHQ
jgi:hypothetical protein